MLGRRWCEYEGLISFLSVQQQQQQQSVPRRKHVSGGRPCPESGNSCVRPLILCPSGLVAISPCARAHTHTYNQIFFLYGSIFF